MLDGNVCITGGSGFLGRAILRRAEREGWPARFTVFSRDESKHIKVRARYPDARIVRGDVTWPVEQLARVFAGHDIVIHAAANKLVDIGESAAFEVARNNVIGSMNVAQAAIQAGVRQVVGIATDKLVQPVNIYGATKFVMERLFQEADSLSDTQFTCARYGNVVGSTISVLLYFRDQLAKDGFIKVTNPEMTRFYMGADEAIDAVLYALNTAQHGSVVIPKMQAMQLADTARMALGRDPEDSIVADRRVKIVGERPGEKLHESLLHTQESVRVVIPEGGDDYAEYFELRPVGEQHRKQPFAITSDKPPLGWMSYEAMAALMEDSKDV